MPTRNYWNGKVALICSYCAKYRSFASVEDLRRHIIKEHIPEPSIKTDDTGKVGG